MMFDVWDSARKLEIGNYIQIFNIWHSKSLLYLPTFKHSFVVNCPIDRVWEFYTNIKHLEIITPTEIELKITSATSQKLNQGSEFWFVGKLMISKRKWHSVIKSIGQYQYLDEMLTGPLKSGGTYTNSMLLTSTTIKSKLK